jgi:hypothetical protein
MDDRLKARIRELALQLLAEEKATFRQAQTFLDLENLVVVMGDELACQLANTDLSAVCGTARACLSGVKRRRLSPRNTGNRSCGR